MKRTSRTRDPGFAIIELNHSGIPEEELYPEEFSEYQLAVLDSLPPKRREAILKGHPVKVVEIATRKEIAEFNMKNFVLSEDQKERLAHTLYDAIVRYLSDPENEAEFEKWKKEQEESKKHT